MSEDQRAAKIDAAEKSLRFVQPGMVVGLGSGTTAAEMVRLLGARVRAGLAIRAVASSGETEALARAEGIHVLVASPRSNASTSRSTAPTRSIPVAA